jgi:DNA ligase (NAD+)
MRWIGALSVPLPQAAAKALTEHSWQQLRDKEAVSWRLLPGVGPEKARKLVEFFHDPAIAAMASWLRTQGIQGF